MHIFVYVIKCLTLSSEQTLVISLITSLYKFCLARSSYVPKKILRFLVNSDFHSNNTLY